MDLWSTTPSAWLRTLTLGLGLLGAGCQAGQSVADRPAERVEGSPQPSSVAAQPAEIDLRRLQPTRTRSGQLRFTDPAIEHNPRATQIFLERLQTEPSAELCAALVEALARTGGDWFEPLAARYDAETRPLVRRAIVAVAVRAEPEQALALIIQALGDGDARVRMEAAMAAGSLPRRAAAPADGVAQLRERLGDDDALTRAAAARTLGVWRDAGSFALLEARLADEDAAVRLQALRALCRIDAARAVALPAWERLCRDPDPKVARAARRAQSSSRPRQR